MFGPGRSLANNQRDAIDERIVDVCQIAYEGCRRKIPSGNLPPELAEGVPIPRGRGLREPCCGEGSLHLRRALVALSARKRLLRRAASPQGRLA